MNISPRAAAIVKLPLVLMMVVAVTECSSGSPTFTLAILADVTLSATTVTAGSTVQATIRLTGTTSTAVAIVLSSSNPAVATVQSPITVQAGASSATATVTGVGAGAATITASLNGTTKQSPALGVTGIALSNLSLSAPSVVGGESVTGTVVLNAAALAGGAMVLLSGADPATVPASVLVAAGSLSATFTILTRPVSGTIPVTIGASYGGATASAMLSVTQPTVATARFGVSGPTESDTCTMTNGGNTLNCTFNGSTSTAPGTITAWDWSYTVASTFSQTTSGPVLTMPTVNCSFLPPPPLPSGSTFFMLTVKLKVHDNLGNVSAEAVNSGVRVFPQGVCGY